MQVGLRSIFRSFAALSSAASLPLGSCPGTSQFLKEVAMLMMANCASSKPWSRKLKNSWLMQKRLTRFSRQSQPIIFSTNFSLSLPRSSYFLRLSSMRYSVFLCVVVQSFQQSVSLVLISAVLSSSSFLSPSSCSSISLSEESYSYFWVLKCPWQSFLSSCSFSLNSVICLILNNTCEKYSSLYSFNVFVFIVREQPSLWPLRHPRHNSAPHSQIDSNTSLCSLHHSSFFLAFSSNFLWERGSVSQASLLCLAQPLPLCTSSLHGSQNTMEHSKHSHSAGFSQRSHSCGRPSQQFLRISKSGELGVQSRLLAMVFPQTHTPNFSCFQRQGSQMKSLQHRVMSGDCGSELHISHLSIFELV